jgi:hypothetical protein
MQFPELLLASGSVSNPHEICYVPLPEVMASIGARQPALVRFCVLAHGNRHSLPAFRRGVRAGLTTPRSPPRPSWHLFLQAARQDRRAWAVIRRGRSAIPLQPRAKLSAAVILDGIAVHSPSSMCGSIPFLRIHSRIRATFSMHETPFDRPRSHWGALSARPATGPRPESVTM